LIGRGASGLPKLRNISKIIEIPQRLYITFSEPDKVNSLIGQKEQRVTNTQK